ncbi:MAG: O-methyltransferase [Clostridiales bacterium]|nr:O-methyltransferase [Clostridiales bacterium]
MSNITNDIITSYIKSLYSCDNPQLNELRAFAEEKKVPVILKDTEGLLLSLLKIKTPCNILEIGTAIGYSACCFAGACDCRVVTIESEPECCDIALSNIKALGFQDKIEVRHGDAREVLGKMAEREKNSFDLVFIDAGKSHYREFWDLSLPLCTNGALIVCDNILMRGMTASDEYDIKRKYKTSIRKMREFIKYINSLDYADTCVLPVGDGVSVSIIDLPDDLDGINGE